VSPGGVSILPVHFVIQIAVRCGESQLFLFCRVVAKIEEESGNQGFQLRDLSPKNANLGILKAF
jgi:hypothetical protein